MKTVRIVGITALAVGVLGLLFFSGCLEPSNITIPTIAVHPGTTFPSYPEFVIPNHAGTKKPVAVHPGVTFPSDTHVIVKNRAVAKKPVAVHPGTTFHSYPEFVMPNHADTKKPVAIYPGVTFFPSDTHTIAKNQVTAQKPTAAKPAASFPMPQPSKNATVIHQTPTGHYTYTQATEIIGRGTEIRDETYVATIAPPVITPKDESYTKIVPPVITPKDELYTKLAMQYLGEYMSGLRNGKGTKDHIEGFERCFTKLSLKAQMDILTAILNAQGGTLGIDVLQVLEKLIDQIPVVE